LNELASEWLASQVQEASPEVGFVEIFFAHQSGSSG
jgi:hypothetical protein